MKILCVEDGSVDIEKIENNGLKDGQVLVYRQGAKVPFVLELDMPEKEKIITDGTRTIEFEPFKVSRYECEDNLRGNLKAEEFNAMFNASKVDITRLYPVTEINVLGETKEFYIGLIPVEDE